MKPTYPFLAASFLFTVTALPACVTINDPLAPLLEFDGGVDAGSDGDAAITWTACDGGPPTTVPCGSMCGTMTVACLFGTVVFGQCEGEGACSWGDQEICGGDGDGTRICGSDCTWGSCDDPLVDP
jgi:hypothetical protein